MNYGISVLFRFIPLLMALICFFFGGYIFGFGNDEARWVAGPVVFRENRSQEKRPGVLYHHRILQGTPPVSYLYRNRCG